MQSCVKVRYFVFSVVLFVWTSGLNSPCVYGQTSGRWELSDPLPKPSAGSGVISTLPPQQVWLWVENPAPGAPLQQQLAPSVLVPQVLPSPSPLTSFNGVIDSPTTGTPPDTHIAVGPGSGSSGRVVMVTNGHVEIWDKTGAVVASPVLLSTIFGATCFDPRVLYDDHSGRFFIACLEGTTTSNSKIHIAVSSSATPNNLTSNWTVMVGSALTTIGGHNTWADFTGLGADDDSIVVTTNLFDNSSNFWGVKIRVFNKASLLTGQYTFVDININVNTTPVFSLEPVYVYGATDSGGFYLVARASASSYYLYTLTGDPASPVATNSLNSWSTGADPSAAGAPQPGTSVHLDSGDGRVMNPVYRNGHIWLALTADADNDGLTEAVWQDILTNGGPPTAPSVNQGGYLKGTIASCWTYTPSATVNSAGDAAICFTQSSGTEFPDVVYAVRSVNDSPGSFRTPIIAKAGPGYYDSFAALNPDRWGDYSACVVDPTNDSFWIANEFAWTSSPSNSDWATFIANVRAPIIGDFNVDGDVDFVDFALFATAWQKTSADPNWNTVFDISSPKDNIVNNLDLGVFAQNWLNGF
jgi:hypothetical protein